jgi:hypothetical protein
MSNYFDNKETGFLAPQITEHGRHMVMTNVQTEIKTKYVNVDTRFQEDYNLRTNADMLIQLPQSIREVKSMKIANVEIPATFYPFSLSQRNTFLKITSSSSSTPRIITIKDGNYTESLLVDSINNEIHTYYSDLSFNYDSFNRKLYINNNSTSVDYTFDFAIDEVGNFDKHDLKSKLGWCLGFREPHYTVIRRTLLSSESVLNIISCRYIFIAIDDFHSHSPNSFVVPRTESYLNSNILARVQLNPSSYSFGGVIVASEMDGKLLSDTRFYSGKNDIQKLRIQLINEFGQVLNLNKVDFSFALVFQYV